MVTVGIFPFKENSRGIAGNRTRDLMISSQKIWPLDHEADPIPPILQPQKLHTLYVPYPLI